MRLSQSKIGGTLLLRPVSDADLRRLPSTSGPSAPPAARCYFPVLTPEFKKMH